MSTASFVHIHQAQQHPGVARMEQAVTSARELGRSFSTSRGLAAMLLAAVVAALLVVADQVIDTWAEGHLLAGWIALWIIGFVALGLLAGTARQLSQRIIKGLDGWSARVAQRRADERLWAIARSDARVMADLKMAMARTEAAAPAAVSEIVASEPGALWAARVVRNKLHYI